MGMYDYVEVPCPHCGKEYLAQSKSGPCTLETYTIENAPSNVLEDVNRHAPFQCDYCETTFSCTRTSLCEPDLVDLLKDMLDAYDKRPREEVILSQAIEAIREYIHGG